MMKNMTLKILKIFLILYFVKPSLEKNQTARNGKVFREYFFLAKSINVYRTWVSNHVFGSPKTDSEILPVLTLKSFCSLIIDLIIIIN